MADIESWLILGISSCTNARDPKEIKQWEVEAILEHASGDFVVGLRTVVIFGTFV